MTNILRQNAGIVNFLSPLEIAVIITLKEDKVSALRVFVLKYYKQCACSDTDL